MSDLVLYSAGEGIAVVTINNPPVNALSPGVPEGIEAAAARAAADPAVEAIVVIGAGRTFIAGADIREFGKIVAGEKPRLNLYGFLNRLEDCPKPVVMALHGTALGGGLEVAMAGHYRVALETAQVGQPEVKLGIIPGAAGTQRLPRLCGVAKAAEMCAFGEPIGAKEALALGIVDRIVEGDLLEGAKTFAREVLLQPVPKVRERGEKLAPADLAPLRAAVARKLRGQTAPPAAIDAVEAAARLPFEDGCEFESKLFNECLFGDQSKALIHIFFGERTVAKIPGLAKGAEVLPVRRAAIVGAGTMGSGIATAYLNAGIPVLLKDAAQEALGRGVAAVRGNLEEAVRRGKLAAAAVEDRMAMLTPALDYSGFGGADIIVEAVYENLELKKKTFAEIDAVARHGAILATNTSTLDVDAIASATSRPEWVVGHHFFSPAHLMRLLEIVRGAKTSDAVLATSMDLAKKLKKVGVLAGNAFGFIGNRMFHAYMREAVFLVEEGATPEFVDRALYDWGMAMGPLAVGDLAGLDVGWRIREEFKHLEVPGVRYPRAGDRLVELGRHGRKTGAGWYRYEADGSPRPDPEVLRIVREVVERDGIAQHEVTREEVLERTLYALINEGCKVLEEGVALRAVDIDIVYVNGYGFPSWRGGPMKYAELTGLARVYKRVLDYHERFGHHWAPAHLLKKLAESGGKFDA
jgi:3-hydroxyacyl-CoA dehydrogenase